MAGSSKRQTTMAKLARERAVKERRDRKQEKKDNKKQAAAAEAETALSAEPLEEDATA